MIFEEIYFLRHILFRDQISLSDCLYLFEMLGNICIVIICLPVDGIINFEIKDTLKAFDDFKNKQKSV